jgi:hypothetical protein
LFQKNKMKYLYDFILFFDKIYLYDFLSQIRLQSFICFLDMHKLYKKNI